MIAASTRKPLDLSLEPFPDMNCWEAFVNEPRQKYFSEFSIFHSDWHKLIIRMKTIFHIIEKVESVHVSKLVLGHKGNHKISPCCSAYHMIHHFDDWSSFWIRRSTEHIPDICWTLDSFRFFGDWPLKSLI